MEAAMAKTVYITHVKHGQCRVLAEGEHPALARFADDIETAEEIARLKYGEGCKIVHDREWPDDDEEWSDA
jgi:hypothetical protein